MICYVRRRFASVQPRGVKRRLMDDPWQPIGSLMCDTGWVWQTSIWQPLKNLNLFVRVCVPREQGISVPRLAPSPPTWAPDVSDGRCRGLGRRSRHVVAFICLVSSRVSRFPSLGKRFGSNRGCRQRSSVGSFCTRVSVVVQWSQSECCTTGTWLFFTQY